ncbi:MAG: InlB B-repeat-containing protein [Acutalibacteraceae bacterium]
MKKAVSVLLTALMLITYANIFAFAAGNSMSSATSISVGSSYSGSISSSNTQDFYKFTLSTSGTVKINLSAYIENLSFFIYDSNGDEVWNYWGYYWNDTAKVLTFIQNFALTSGTYYFAVTNYGEHYGNYSFSTSFTSSNESFKEITNGTNNSMASASSITIGNKIYGQIASNDDRDIYKFTLADSGRVNINFTAPIECLSFYIYDVNGDTVWDDTWYCWNSTAEKLTMIQNFDLTVGTYYFAVVRCDNHNKRTGDYNFTTTYTKANESFEESNGGSNNTINTANSILLNTQYIGQIARNDEKDFYKFSVSSAGKQKIELEAAIESLSFYVYDLNGETVWSYTWYYWNSTAQKLKFDEEVDFSKSGTYYFAVVRCDNGESRTGPYTFSVGNNPVTSYTVTYNANGGSVSPSSASVTAGSSVKLPTPTKSYNITYNANGGSGAPSSQSAALTCKGWSTSSPATSASYSCGASYTPSADTTLYAVWSSSTSLTLSSTKPTRSGYTFLGWSTSSSASSASFQTGATVTLSGNVTLYAVWQKNSQTVPVVKGLNIRESVELDYKESYTFTPEITADSGANYIVEWESSNPGTVSVDENGNIYGAKKGNATITCTVTDSQGNIFTDTCDVKVSYNFGQWLIIILLFGWIWY